MPPLPGQGYSLITHDGRAGGAAAVSRRDFAKPRITRELPNLPGSGMRFRTGNASFQEWETILPSLMQTRHLGMAVPFPSAASWSLLGLSLRTSPFVLLANIRLLEVGGDQSTVMERWANHNRFGGRC